MKTAKRSNTAKGGSEPSILNYFSKSKRNKKALKSQTTTPTSFGTPATPLARHHVHKTIDEYETPASVVSDDSNTLKPFNETSAVDGDNAAVNRNAAHDRHGTPETSASTTPMSSTTPATNEPNTPPSPPTEDRAAIKDNAVLSAREKSVAQSAHSTETPPSNDTEMTTPASPPTPDTWIDSLVGGDQKENNCNYTKGVQSHKHEGKAKDYTDTPKSLQETTDTPAQNNSKRQHQSQSIDLGTPSTACSPSVTPSSIPPAAASNNFFRKYASKSSTNQPNNNSSKTKKANQNNTSFSSNQQQANNAKPVKRQKQSSNQLFLDFGQNSFGKQTICGICGMLRVHGLDEDDAQHANICQDYKEGVKCLGWKNERSVATFFGKDDRILEVRPEDALLHRKKIAEVKSIVDKELGFANDRTNSGDDSSDEGTGSLTSYMYISNKRVVGLLMVKRIQRAYELLSSKEGGCNNNDTSGTGNAASISRSLKPSKALLGVHQIWVHNSHRQKGIASKLVTAARDHLIFGMLVPYELVAFSSPTEEGLRFAKSYIDSERPLIYDIH